MSTKKGDDWNSLLYFYCYDLKRSWQIEDIDLTRQLQQIIQDTNIETVSSFKNPLSDYQVTSVVVYHLMIVFKTGSWWWSIEKQGDGITLQRSKGLQTLLDNHRGEKRNVTGKYTKTMEDRGNKRIMEVIEWLKENGELNKAYHYLSTNCKEFAKRLFDFVAKSKTLHWYDSAFD